MKKKEFIERYGIEAHNKRLRQVRDWQAAHPEKVKANNAVWRAAHPEKAKADQAAWRAANPEKNKANQAAWRAANPEKAKADQAAWRAANPEKAKANNAAWRAANPEKAKANNAAWRAAHPEKVKASNYITNLITNPEKNRKGGKYYVKKHLYDITGIQGEKQTIRANHNRIYQPIKRIIDPKGKSNIHHVWQANSSEYAAVGIVEAKGHRHGIINVFSTEDCKYEDVIAMLEGKIELSHEKDIPKFEARLLISIERGLAVKSQK